MLASSVRVEFILCRELSFANIANEVAMAVLVDSISTTKHVAAFAANKVLVFSVASCNVFSWS